MKRRFLIGQADRAAGKGTGGAGAPGGRIYPADVILIAKGVGKTEAAAQQLDEAAQEAQDTEELSRRNALISSQTMPCSAVMSAPSTPEWDPPQ